MAAQKTASAEQRPQAHPGYVPGETRRFRDGSIEIDAGRIADSWTSLTEWYAARGVPSLVARGGHRK